MEPIMLTAAAVASLAAAVKGGEYLWRKGREARRASVLWWEERRRVRRVLAELTAEEGWGNGSKSLRESHRDLYERVAGIDLKVNDLASAIEQLIVVGGVRGGESSVREG